MISHNLPPDDSIALPSGAFFNRLLEVRPQWIRMRDLLDPVLSAGAGSGAAGDRGRGWKTHGAGDRGVSATGIAKFAQGNARVFSCTWRRLLSWYDACVEAGAPPVDSKQMAIAIAALVRDLAPDVAARTVVELREFVEEAFRLHPVVMPLMDVSPTPRASRPRVRPRVMGIRQEVPAAGPTPAGRVLPGRRPARFRGGMLLRGRALWT